MYSFFRNYDIIRDRKRAINVKVNIKMILKYDDKIIEEQISGIYKKDEEELYFVDSNQNGMHFYFHDNLFVRDTKESIFSYDFKTDGSLEIYLKDYRKGTRMPLTTIYSKKDEYSFEVVYQIEGNDFKHEIKVEWEKI